MFVWNVLIHFPSVVVPITKILSHSQSHQHR